MWVSRKIVFPAERIAGALRWRGRLNNGPTKYIHVQMLRTCACYLICKEDLASVIKERILRWGDYLDYSNGHKIITTLLTRKTEEQSRVREDEGHPDDSVGFGV